MNILLTGGLGFIGSHTAIELVRKGYEIVIVDNLSNSDLNVLTKLNFLLKTSIKFYKNDLRNQEEIRKIFSENKFDAVIHFAGLKAVGESVVNPYSYYDNNVVGSINLIKVMTEFDCKKIIFSSSATVYGDPIELPISESANLSSVNPYGETKLVIENFIDSIYKSDNEWNYAILRYFNPVGGHDSHDFGERPSGIPNNLMPYICQVGAKKLEFLRVFGNDYETRDGTGVRDYIHVVDLALGHIAALEYVLHKSFPICANLGTGKGFSVLEMIKTFETVNKVDIPYVITERRAGDIASCYASTKLAKELLGWEAKFNLEDMCRDSWKSQLKIDHSELN